MGRFMGNCFPRYTTQHLKQKILVGFYSKVYPPEISDNQVKIRMAVLRDSGVLTKRPSNIFCKNFILAVVPFLGNVFGMTFFKPYSILNHIKTEPH